MSAATQWRDLVDLEKLSSWMEIVGLGPGSIDDPVPLAGGTQNVLLRFSRGGQSYVLRRPPLHSIANGSETMRREARVLAAIRDSAVPHARLIAACPDESVLGAAFYLMEPVDGFNATVAMPPLHAGDPAIRRRMGFAMVDAILALGRVDPRAGGLEDFGHLDNFLERQSARWLAQYAGYSRHAGWSAESLGGIDDLAAWLDAHCPRAFIPGILHGDFHLANVMFRNDGPGIAAVVDWELASIGDPLIDLGWLLATWPDPEDGGAAITPVAPWDGFPDATELADRYAAGSHRNTSHLLWFKVLACYKLAILLEGSQARALAGKADTAIGQRLHEQAILLLRRAHRAIAKGAL